MPEKARPLALPPTGLLRLHARAAGVAVLLVALSAVSRSEYLRVGKECRL